MEVADTGEGADEETVRRAFEPFFTTKPTGEGTGLGLGISRNLVVQKHGGEISVDSKPGRTCFAVRLPLDSGPGE